MYSPIALADGGVLYLRYSTFLLGGESYIFLKVKSVETWYWLGRCSLVFSSFFVQKTQIERHSHCFLQNQNKHDFLFIRQKFDQNNNESKKHLPNWYLTSRNLTFKYSPLFVDSFKKRSSMTSIVKLELAELIQCRFLPTILCDDFFHW